MRSESPLQKAVEYYPHIINQSNVFGQAPLHLAASQWPEVVQQLLDVEADYDVIDNASFTAFEYALLSGSLDSMRILDEIGCRIDQDFLDLHCEIEQRMAKAPPYEMRDMEAFKNLITILAGRRRKLENLATISLDRDSLCQLELSHGRLLDAKARLAVSMLQARGVPVPKSLLCIPSEAMVDYFHHSPERCMEKFPGAITVYHNTFLTARHTEALWDCGFQDTNSLNNLGLHVLMWQGLIWPLHRLEERLRLFHWYISKGTDPCTRQRYMFQRLPIKERRIGKEYFLTQVSSATTILHHLGAQIGTAFWYGIYITYKRNTKALPEVKWMLELNGSTKEALLSVLNHDVKDNCQCPCSSNGCSALTMVLKDLSMCGDMLPMAKSEMSLSLAGQLYDGIIATETSWLETLRLLVFEELQLKHTCCSLASYSIGNRTLEVIAELSDEEIQEIMEDQEEQVQKLESVLVSVAERYRRAGIPFSTFLRTCWKEVMDDVMYSKEPINKEKLLKIGVTLYAEDGEDVKPSR